MKKAFGLAVLAYLLVTFPVAYVWHLIAFHEAYERIEVYRADMIIPFGLGSMMIQAVFFAWAYPRLFSTRRQDWLGSAVRFFGVFVLLSWSYNVLPVAAKYRMSSVPDFIALETGFTLLHFALIAPLIALAYRVGDEVHGALHPSARH